MSALSERIQKARESWVTVGGREFLVRRPTQRQWAQWSKKGDEEFLKQCIVDWRGVTELDLAPGGTGAAAAFDADALIEWLGDRPDDWVAVMQAIVEAMQAFLARQEAVAKN